MCTFQLCWVVGDASFADSRERNKSFATFEPNDVQQIVAFRTTSAAELKWILYSATLAGRSFSHRKVGFVGCKEFGSGYRPLPQSPRLFLFSTTICSSYRTTSHLLGKQTTVPHKSTTRSWFVLYYYLHKDWPTDYCCIKWFEITHLVCPNAQNDCLTVSNVCCSHGQVGETVNGILDHCRPTPL